jgi:CDP-diacylglycerol pyrophosphatase
MPHTVNMLKRHTLSAAMLLAALATLAACQLAPAPTPGPSAASYSPPFPRVHGPNALWSIVSQQCLPDLAHNGSPAPCTSIEHGDRPDGYVILKDIVGKSQYLLIPTARVQGIETPSLLQVHAPRYFADAWDSRHFVSTALGRPLQDDEVSLAINPVHARSQQQLHIHIDCLDAQVGRDLSRYAVPFGDAWTPIESNGRTLNVRRMTVTQLHTTNLFKLVADTVPGAANSMGGETILVTGAGPSSESAGVYIIESNFDATAPGRWAAESLQDHACRS